MKDRPQRTDSDLRESARDITYELMMLIESASDIGAVWRSPQTTLADKEKNMALECFLLHYRNLRAFLCPSLQGAPPKPNDVLASDFLGRPHPEDLGDASKVGADKERLDQMLAHLTYNRHKEYKAKGNTDWHVGTMAVAILQEVDAFLSRVPDYVQPWFPERTMLAQKRVWFEQWADNSRCMNTTTSPVVLSVIVPTPGQK